MIKSSGSRSACGAIVVCFGIVAVGHAAPAKASKPTPTDGFSKLLADGEKAYEARDFDRAIELYNRALALNVAPAQASAALMDRGNAFWRKNDIDRALADHEQAIRLNPRNAAAYVDRALDLDAKGDHTAALRDLNEAIRLKPTDAFAFYNRAAILLDQGEIDRALQDYSKVIEFQPSDSDAHVGRAAAFRRKQQFEKALAECNSAIGSDPTSVRAYQERIKAHAQMKRYSDAAKDLEILSKVKAKPRSLALNTVAWIHATCADAAMRDGAKAVAEATEACELDHWQLWSSIDTLAAAYAEAGNFERAIKYEQQALTMMPAPNKRNELTLRLGLYQQHKPFREDPNVL